MPLDPSFAPAIANIESGGNYSILGPETKGDRAYGKYQVMGANVGPWTKEILGFEMSPQEFLSNPQAQDAVFQGKFDQYVQKFGPEGAAQAWFAGPGGVGKLDRKDVLGTTVAQYGQKFMKGIGQSGPSDPIAPQMPAGESAPQSMPAYGWSPNNAPQPTAAPQQTQADYQTPALSAPQLQIAAAQRRPPDPAHLQALLKMNPAIAPGFRFLRT